VQHRRKVTDMAKKKVAAKAAKGKFGGKKAAPFKKKK
jgi:hypothetical protein